MECLRENATLRVEGKIFGVVVIGITIYSVLVPDSVVTPSVDLIG
jgi:hypothetical protein